VGLILAIVGNAFGLWVTTQLVPGITFHGSLVTLLVAGALWGLFNLIVRPIAVILTWRAVRQCVVLRVCLSALWRVWISTWSVEHSRS